MEGLNTTSLFDSTLEGACPSSSQNDNIQWNVICYQSMSGDSSTGTGRFNMNFRISKKWLWIGAGIITAVFVTAFLIFYYFFKTDYTPYGFYNVLINYLVLIGITVWSVGILYRLQQRTSWKLFLAVVFLVQGWLISSIFKWTAEPGTGFARFMCLL